MGSSGLPFLSLSRDLPIFILYNWWDWDFNREEFLHSFVEHCEDHLLNPFYIAFPNTELQKEGGDKAGIEAMIDYMNKHGIQMSSIPEQTRKYLEGENDVSLGYWLAVLATDCQAEHDKVHGYEELPGDVSIFDGDNSFDLLAGVPKWHDKPLHKPCTSVNLIQDHSPLIDHTQECVRKQTQDTMLTELQFGAPHPK
jgi:hypothetical protein